MDNKPTNITPTQQSIPTNAQQQSISNNQGLFSNPQQQQQQQQSSFNSLFGVNIAQQQTMSQPTNVFGFGNSNAQQQQIFNQSPVFSNAQQQQIVNQSPMFSNAQQQQYGFMPQQQMPYPQYGYGANNLFGNLAPNMSQVPVPTTFNDDEKIIERVK